MVLETTGNMLVGLLSEGRGEPVQAVSRGLMCFGAAWRRDCRGKGSTRTPSGEAAVVIRRDSGVDWGGSERAQPSERPRRSNREAGGEPRGGSIPGGGGDPLCQRLSGQGKVRSEN